MFLPICLPWLLSTNGVTPFNTLTDISCCIFLWKFTALAESFGCIKPSLSTGKLSRKVAVYIDGFNFYFGLKHNTKWKKYYWLDIVKWFESFMRPNQELVAVKYFSANPDDLEQSLKQNAFFQANKENSKFKLVLGKYLKKEITCFR